jgi:hypothetical protein
VTDVMAAMRDASWYTRPGRAEVFHVAMIVGDDTWMPACNQRATEPGMRGVILNEDTLTDASGIRESRRCRRAGCRQRWPK